MAVNVDRIPLNTIPGQWAFDPEIGPFIRSLLETIKYLRDRTGGDIDMVASNTSASSTNFYAGGFYEEGRPVEFLPVPDHEEENEFSKRYALLLS